MQLPNPANPDLRDYDEERGEVGGYGANGAGSGGSGKDGGVGGKDGNGIKFSIVQRIDHPGEVNKARYMPQNPDLIATIGIEGRVLVWDRTKHSSMPNGMPNPQLRLAGHDKEGYGLSWSPHREGQLVTGSEDGTVKLWYVFLLLSSS